MIIQHNICASYTLNTLKSNNLKKSKSIGKLSSGSRINNAADDAAGLSISEKMKTQIRGLNQAARNVQDGISLVKVAEAGLANILEPPLQRLRELAVQASNGTLSYEDRQMVQDEVDQIIDAVDSIAQNTNFNDIRLIDGSLKRPIISEPIIITPLSFKWDIDFESPKQINAISATDDGGLVIAGTTHKSAGHTESNDRSSWIVKINSEGEVEWETIIPKDNEYNGVYDIKQMKNGEYILTTRSNAVIGNDASNNEPIIYKLGTDGNVKHKVKLSGGNEYLFCINETKDGGFISTGTSGNRAIFKKFDSNLNTTKTVVLNRPSDSHFKSGLDVKETSDGGYIIAGEELYEYPDEKGFVIKLDSNFNVEWETKIDNEAFQSVVEDEKGSYIVLGKSLYKIDDKGNSHIINSDIGCIIDTIGEGQNYITKTQDSNYLIGTRNKVYKVDSMGNEIWNVELDSGSKVRAATQIDDGGYVVVAGQGSVIKFEYDVYKEPPPARDGLYLQIGANSGDGFHIYIDDNSSNALGIKNINMTTQRGAQEAIYLVDKAIKQVSSERSKLGAYENRLVHIVNNIETSAENLQSAESGIRDVDMAKALMDLTKQKIFEEANIAMLVQGSKQPAQVLNLLR